MRAARPAAARRAAGVRALVGYFAHPKVGPALAQFFCFQLAFLTFTSGFALFAERRFHWDGAPFGPREIGYVFVYIGGLGVLFQGVVVGWLVDRLGERRVAAAGFAALALGFAVLGLATTVPVLLLSATCSAFGSSVVRPALTSLVSRAVEAHAQGAVLGVTQSLTATAAIVAPLAAGLLLDVGWLAAWAWTAAAVACVGLALGARPG